jgi:GNAT superfamily N-acetyltransferase
MPASLPDSVSMARQVEAPFPLFPLPPGYALSWYQPGCEAWWFEIQRRADPLAPITAGTFAKYFGTAPGELSRRQAFLLEPAGRPIGTATAWFEQDERGQEWGRLHWVAILPEWQGRGLGRPLLSDVCQRMHTLHPQRSFLRTAPHRLAAIRLYLAFGFQPLIGTPHEASAWRQILGRLGQP